MSVEALQFVGFSKTPAEEIFAELSNVSSEISEESSELSKLQYFSDHMKYYIDGEDDAVTASDNGELMLSITGAKQSVVRAICDPRFESLRNTRTTKEWFSYTVFCSWN